MKFCANASKILVRRGFIDNFGSFNWQDKGQSLFSGVTIAHRNHLNPFNDGSDSLSDADAHRAKCVPAANAT